MADTSCTTCDTACRDVCETTCRSVADVVTIYEVDSKGNLCGCGASCTSACGSSCEGTSSNIKISIAADVEVADVVKNKYDDLSVYDNSKNTFR